MTTGDILVLNVIGNINLFTRQCCVPICFVRWWMGTVLTLTWKIWGNHGKLQGDHFPDWECNIANCCIYWKLHHCLLLKLHCLADGQFQIFLYNRLCIAFRFCKACWQRTVILICSCWLVSSWKVITTAWQLENNSVFNHKW